MAYFPGNASDNIAGIGEPGSSLYLEPAVAIAVTIALFSFFTVIASTLPEFEVVAADILQHALSRPPDCLFPLLGVTERSITD